MNGEAILQDVHATELSAGLARSSSRNRSPLNPDEIVRQGTRALAVGACRAGFASIGKGYLAHRPAARSDGEAAKCAALGRAECALRVLGRRLGHDRTCGDRDRHACRKGDARFPCHGDGLEPSLYGRNWAEAAAACHDEEGVARAKPALDVGRVRLVPPRRPSQSESWANRVRPSRTRLLLRKPLVLDLAAGAAVAVVVAGAEHRVGFGAAFAALDRV